MKKEKSCGAILTRNNENGVQVLLLRHKNGGHWAFPKGHVEGDETEAQTAIREIKEETGLDAEIDTDFRETVTFSPKENVLKDVVYFTGKVKSGTQMAQLEEVLDLRWENFSDALDTLTYENDRGVLKKLKDYLKI